MSWLRRRPEVPEPAVAPEHRQAMRRTATNLERTADQLREVGSALEERREAVDRLRRYFERAREVNHLSERMRRALEGDVGGGAP